MFFLFRHPRTACQDDEFIYSQTTAENPVTRVKSPFNMSYILSYQLYYDMYFTLQPFEVKVEMHKVINRNSENPRVFWESLAETLEPGSTDYARMFWVFDGVKTNMRMSKDANAVQRTVDILDESFVRERLSTPGAFYRPLPPHGAHADACVQGCGPSLPYSRSPG